MANTQPADKSQFILPDLGEGVHEAELIRWKVKPGDKVEELQTLAEMETDKALVEVPSPWAGVIKELRGNKGDIIPVGSVLVTYEVESGQPSAPPAQVESDDAGTIVGSVGAELAVSERFTRRRAEEPAAAATTKALATPAVRRVARELGIDINQVRGTGRGGRVTAHDVHEVAGGPAREATVAPEAEAPLPPPAMSPDGEGVVQRIPLRGVRRKVAQSLEHSLRTAVHFTVTEEADVTALDRKRQEYAAVLGGKLSFLPLVMTAVGRALKQHPALNANVDDERQEILVKGAINLGIAVDTEQGLTVAVIRDADKLSISQLSDAVDDVAERCRNRTIGRDELMGGTFTISSVGSFGGMFATPIINYPEVAILAVGRVRDQVLVKDGMFYAGRIMPLSLSCDHRIIDGAAGARFLSTLVELLEQPGMLAGPTQ
ncbi:MAG: dihydrolipoamide acetyltransferase family protein [Planctomycetota bacterium]|jgi:pyruvate dehydrogenase E2 component (dihydrolipoamide acetyltransferase)